MAALLNTHHKLPQMPKDMRATTGNVTCSIAPGRALSTIKGATREYPIHTQPHACQGERPSVTIEDAIIQLTRTGILIRNELDDSM